MKGIVFDIQKFALHDGPGIRTVVFLKGCPFKCVWCCNPESIDPEPQLAFDANKCRNCGVCANECPVNALNFSGGKLAVDFEFCTACGKCLEHCTPGALRIYGYETDSDSILKEVLKDVDYFRNSGGGLTLSGGDPLFRFDFAVEILTKAKAHGLNTCIESEGFGTTDQFKKLLPLVDHFYFDYKITDDFLHTKYTGVSNEIVLANLNFLASSNADITLRCIVIPGINDSDDHFTAISALSRQYPTIKTIEVMPYHDFGTSKYIQIGKPIYPIDSKSATNDQATRWINRLSELGCKNLKKG
jgi:pyruvate formate lyase activating enzyme